MIQHMSADQLVGKRVGAYSLERFIGQSKLGPSFLVHTDPTTIALLRFLESAVPTTPQEREAYLEHFHSRANQIATLHHPSILPLVDFGVFRGIPFLVTPPISLRSLRNRLDKNGSLNIFTVGRYLDQIATTLEYAHEHAVLHGTLSVDTIFIRLDGQLLVADFGVGSLLEVNNLEKPGQHFLAWREGYAPEQLLGKPPQPTSDVYALGAVAYHLLTGTSIFAGSTGDDNAQQHPYASLLPLSRRQSDLPGGLYSILARAMEKDPAQRFHQPGAFANAYHRAIDPTNRTRVPFVVSEASNLHILHPLVPETTWGEAPKTDHEQRTNRSEGAELTAEEMRSTLPSSMPHSRHGFVNEKPERRNDSPRPALMRRFQNQHRRRVLQVASLVLLAVIASSVVVGLLLAQKNRSLSPASGQVTFFANQQQAAEQTNALQITLAHLGPPPAGEVYEAWILNDQSEEVLDIGRLRETNQRWSLTFSGTSGTSNLLAVGDKLEITEEQGAVTAPAGPVILVGGFPAKSFQHIRHLLVSFPPTPGKTALLLGLIQQTHLLDNQAIMLQSVVSSGNRAMMSCVTQSMLDIIEGTQGLHYQTLAPECIQHAAITYGDGFGLLGKGYVSSAEKHAALALSQPDATAVMHQHAALMDIALANITAWVMTMESGILQVQAHPTDLPALQEITTLADTVYHGVDANGDGHIDPVTGEAGALIAFQQGQLMATVTLAPAA